MSSKGFIIFAAGITFAGLATLRCSLSPHMSITGPGSETVAITGRIVDTLGRPVSQARVVLVPAACNPVADAAISPAQTATTNMEGNYVLSAPDSGFYNIQADRNENLTNLLIPSIRVGKDSVFVPVDTLRIPGTIKVVLPNGLDVTNGYFYIQGTTIFSLLSNNDGFVLLGSVPARVNLSVYYAVKGSSTLPQLVRDSVVVTPGGITTIQYIGWSFSKRLYINTTATGANVSGNVVAFPVLVLLTKSNFDFSQSVRSGADIRFSKSDGAPLPYEIESWDSAAGAAEVWVKVDTVYGNDSSHSIIMYWGNSKVSTESNSTLVFDTANGFQGVWHMGPNLGDATGNGDNGIDSSTVDAAGIIGQCRHFNPAQRSFITIPNGSRFNLTTNITLSAWVLVDSFTYEWQTIVAKGDHAFRLHCDTTNKVGVFSLTCADTVNSGHQDAHGITPINDHKWHLLTGVYDGSVMRMYTDGILERELVVNMPCTTDTLNLAIGDNRQHSPRFFAGSIDEVRVLNTAMTGDWVELCYMNQRQSDALIIFK